MAETDDLTRDPAEKWTIQLRKGLIELAVLAVIGQHSRYGLEIMHALAEFDGLEVPEGTLYPLLNRLRQVGWLEAEWVESSGGHPRKYYRLTPLGRRQLAERARAWTEIARSVHNLVKPFA